MLTLALMDGRSISVPLARFPRPLYATPQQRARWEPAGAGYGIYRPGLDDDLSTEPVFPTWARSTPETLLLGRSSVNLRACLPTYLGRKGLLNLGPGADPG